MAGHSKKSELARVTSLLEPGELNSYKPELRKGRDRTVPRQHTQDVEDSRGVVDNSNK